MEWPTSINNGIKRFKEEIVSLIEKGFYGMAGMELLSSAFEIELGVKKMPQDGLCAHTIGLMARLRLLSEYCIGEEKIKARENKKDSKKRLIDNLIEDIENKITIIERMLKPFLTD